MIYPFCPPSRLLLLSLCRKTLKLESTLNGDVGTVVKRQSEIKFNDRGCYNEDDRASLLEEGLTNSLSTKFHVSSIKMNLIRFVTMDDYFLLENRANFRAMSELGSILVYFSKLARRFYQDV